MTRECGDDVKTVPTEEPIKAVNSTTCTFRDLIIVLKWHEWTSLETAEMMSQAAASGYLL